MFIAVDIGGTSIRVAGAHSLDEPTFVDSPKSFRHTGSFNDDMARLIDYAKRITVCHKVLGVGIGITGEINYQKTHLDSAHNLSHWVGRDMVEIFKRELEIEQIVIENDTVTAALGDALYGCKQANFDYIVWGTGIGGARVKISESGLITVTDHNSTMTEELMSWEAVCGGSAIEKLFSKTTYELSAEDWTSVFGQFKQHLDSYTQNSRPQAIVFGGGLAIKHRSFIESLQVFYDDIPIQVSRFGGNSGLMGGFGLLKVPNLIVNGAADQNFTK